MSNKKNILEFNNKWKKTTLSELAEYVQRGKSPKYSDKENNFPILNQKCIHWQNIYYEHVKFLTKDFWENIDEERFLKSGDILLNSTGTGTIGRASIYYPSKFKKITVDSHITIIRAKKNINPYFIFYFLASPYVQTDIEIIFSGSTDQVELNLPSIKEIAIPDLDIKIQEKIVIKINNFYKNYYMAKDLLSLVNEKEIKGQFLKLEKKFLLDVFA